MGQRHASTATDRVQWVSRMIAHVGEYGVVTALSRAAGVSRQTLYTWAAVGERALLAAFTPRAPARVVTPVLERAVLTLLVDGHARYRGIRACPRALGHGEVSLGAIAAIVAEAQRRALAWPRTHAPAGARPVALDELDGNDRHGG